MRIVIDLTAIHDHLTGIERYNINISKSMILHHPENEYILIFKQCVHDEFCTIIKQKNIKHIIIQECSKLVFIQYKLYKTIKSIVADYYLFLSFTSPICFKRKGIINAIHDLTCWDCPETVPTKMKLYYRITFRFAVKNSLKIVTVSKFSQSRICDKYGIKKNDVPIIYDGLTDVFRNPPLANSELRQKYHLPDKYILSLSTLEPRKNLKLLIAAYAEMKQAGEELPDLVLAGRQGWKLEEVMGVVPETIKKHIHFTGFIEDNDLPQIYRDALIFVFPSIYEGFGLPIIEAFSQGTTVICSDAASLPEIASDAGYIFESNSKEDLKKTILLAINDTESNIRQKKEKGIDISFSYNWIKESEKLHDLLCKCLLQNTRVK